VIRGVLFDFDGLILETEGPAYQSWVEVYRDHGHELPRDRWLDYIGRESGWFDAMAHLESLVGRALDRDAVRARREARRNAIVEGLGCMAGVREWVDEAGQAGLKRAVVSSSSRAYVRTHLERIGLVEHWDALVCREDAPRAKPAPDLYTRALEVVGLDASEAIAIEDSPNGIAAAKAAGLRVVAVPNELTSALDLSRADLRLASCADVTLADLLKKLA
jgi:HAD superfamily hydrolase (TIGR01509 family)